MKKENNKDFISGRLHQYWRMKQQRPIDPIYWDEHEKNDLYELSKKAWDEFRDLQKVMAGQMGLEEPDPKKFVQETYPDAGCHGPVNTYWPGQGERKGVWIVTTAPHSSATFAAGKDEKEGWERAANRIAQEMMWDAVIRYRLDYDKVTDLLKRLVDKLDVILPKVDSIIGLQVIRAGRQIYDGPNIEQEMKEAKELLKERCPTCKKSADEYQSFIVTGLAMNPNASLDCSDEFHKK